MGVGEIPVFAGLNSIQARRAAARNSDGANSGAPIFSLPLMHDSIHFRGNIEKRSTNTTLASRQTAQGNPVRGPVKFAGFSGTTHEVTIQNLPSDARWVLDYLSKKLNMLPKAVAMEVSALAAEVLEGNPKVPSREKPQKHFMLIRNPENAFSPLGWRVVFPEFEDTVPTLAHQNVSYSRLFPPSNEETILGVPRASREWRHWKRIHGLLLPKPDMSIYPPRTGLETGLSATGWLKYVKALDEHPQPPFTFPLHIPQAVYDAHGRFMFLPESMGIVPHVDRNAQRYLDEGLRAVYKLFKAKERHPDAVLAICYDYGEGHQGRQIVTQLKPHIFPGLSLLR